MSGPFTIYPLAEHFPLAMKQNNQMSAYSSVISLMDNKTTYINAKKKFRLKVDTVNEHLRKMEYAVRGVVPTKAGEIETAIKNVSVGIPNGTSSAFNLVFPIAGN